VVVLAVPYIVKVIVSTFLGSGSYERRKKSTCDEDERFDALALLDFLDDFENLVNLEPLEDFSSLSKMEQLMPSVTI